MTGNEIKKALECCIKSSHFGECFENECPMVSEKGCAVGKETLYPYALDLINRLQAEIKDLQKVVVDDYASEYDNKIKAEAYKECAEKIKQKTLAMIYSPDEISTDDYIKCIGDVVKELEGDNDEKTIQKQSNG